MKIDVFKNNIKCKMLYEFLPSVISKINPLHSSIYFVKLYCRVIVFDQRDNNF